MKPRAPKPIKSFDVPIYGGQVWFFRSRKAYVKALQYIGLEDDIGKLSGCFSYVESKDGRVVYLVGHFDKIRSTLAHEVGHLAIYVLRRAGINPCDSGGEVFCYLLSEVLAILGLDRK